MNTGVIYPAAVSDLVDLVHLNSLNSSVLFKI